MRGIKFRGGWNTGLPILHDDLIFAKGTEDELLGRLQLKLGQNEYEINGLLTKL